MDAATRRQEIMQFLSVRRHATIASLAQRFHVSDRTIRRDIEVLSLSEPIYTQAGRYDGGVYVLEGYRFCRSGVTALQREVIAQLLARIRDNRCYISEAEQEILREILCQNGSVAQ